MKAQLEMKQLDTGEETSEATGMATINHYPINQDQNQDQPPPKNTKNTYFS